MVAHRYKIEELLHRNARTQAYRGRVSETGEKVIIRIPARGQQPSALRREVELLDLLGVRVQTIRPRDAGLDVSTAVVSADPSGAVLEPLLGASFELGTALPLAIDLVHQIELAHRAGVVLKDVTPLNLLVDLSERRVCFITYGIASLVRRERSAVAHPESMEGSLAYISPEQTGRMNREVDYRTDFYSLGVTLYQLVTGDLPFESEDPLELVHAHIARAPTPPHRIESTVPRVLSKLILKLLAKNAEDRYQTCAGVLRDLERIQAALAAGEEPDFEIAREDHSDKFLIPQELYGRREDLARLLEAFDRSASGSPELVLVSGSPGIGKTALVREVHRPTVVRRGFFTSGKFDMLDQSVPYTGFVAAFRELVHQLLTESVAAIAQWRQAFEKALGDQAQVLIELIPELQLIIGEQPSAESVDTGSAEKRLRILLARFVQVFTAGLRPLVVFLDDLQWADAASMKLLEHLANTGDNRSLLLVGTYRDNEIDARHPLTRAIERMKESELVLSEIALAPLDQDAVTRLVADTLHEQSERVGALAALLREKTGGNPFFLRQFFATLHESGKLFWLVDEQRWDWELQTVRELEHAPNVVDLMVSKLRKLPGPSQRVLETAACIGNRFELQTLAKLLAREPEQVHEDLWTAVQQGMVRSSELHERDATYTFVHDRIQEAAYSLLNDGERRSVHLRVGRQLWRDNPADMVEARIFDICRHLNACLELIDDDDERHRLAKLELIAGRRAKAATAYDSARSHFIAGLSLASTSTDGVRDEERAWDLDYDLTFKLHRELAECEYLLDELEAADRHFDRILARARTDLAKVEIFTLKAMLAYHDSEYPDGFASTQAGLAILGVEVPAVDDNEGLAVLATREATLLGQRLEGRSIAELIDLPSMSDPHALAEAALLNELSMLGMFLNPALNGIGAVKRVRLSIEQGNSRFSAPAYAAHGMIVGAVAREREAGYAFGKMALDLARRQGDRRAECQAGFWFGTYICHWGAPLDESIPVLAAGVEYGLRMGAPIWAAYNAFFLPVHTFVAGRHLDEVDDMLDRYMPVLDPASYSGCVGYKQLVARLTGRESEPAALVGGSEDEEAFIETLDQPTMQLPLKHFFVAKLSELVVFGRTDEAITLVERANASGDIALVLFGQVAVIWWAMIESLALCDALIHGHASEDKTRREAWRAEVEICRGRLADYAQLAPMNYADMHLLVEAEWACSAGRQLDALELYDQAIRAARDNESGLVEALANERAAAFHRDQGRDSVAAGYIREACHRYASWGATAKVEQLREEYPDEVAEHRAGTDSEGLTDSRAIDLTAVLRASRVLTSEIDLDRLLETTMKIVLENAGAEQGVMIVSEGEELWIEAAGKLDGPRAEIQTFAYSPIPLENDQGLPICVSIAQYVVRTRETLVLDDAHERGRMVQNPYVAANAVRSVICTPLIHQGRLYGIIYLENNLVAGAFTPGRVETLKLLASHSVIAIQNARLYANLNRYSHELERVNKAMSRFVPSEFLRCLGKERLVEVGLGQNVSKEMSILFSDIRGFTTLIESLPKPKHIEFINEYLQYMEPAIANNEGFVDSYIGDAIMALFEGNSRFAIQAGVDMSAELRELNSRRCARGEAPVNMGVGVNSGPLTLGTIGGPTRIKCGVIGESVNLAARIQELTKRYRAFLLASESSIAALDDPNTYTSRVVGRVIVVGMNQPTTLYEVLDAELSLSLRDSKLESLPAYNRGVAAFYAREFDDAAAEFDRCLAILPEDTPVALYRAECDRFRRELPPEGWDGVVRLSKKS